MKKRETGVYLRDNLSFINPFRILRNIDKVKKTEIMEKFARQPGDVGSPEVQIAVLTRKISELTEHMRAHKKDHSARRGLMAMVNRRKKLLTYLAKEDHAKYLEISSTLGIRGQK